MSENIVTKELIEQMIKTHICPKDGQPFQDMHVVRKGRSRYLRVSHHINGKRKECHIGKVTDEALISLIKNSNPQKTLRKITAEFTDESWLAILNILEDQLMIMENEELKSKIAKKLNEIIDIVEKRQVQVSS